MRAIGTPKMIIDFSTHLITDDVTRVLQKKGYYYGPDDRWLFRVPWQNANIGERVGMMDRFGIDVQALSLTSGTLTGLSAEEASAICSLTNDGIVKFCEKHPDRFIGIAAVSLLDVGSALDELERAIRDLGFRAVILATNQDGKGLDSHEFRIFYDRVIRHDIPIFLHPTHWKSYPLVDDNMMTIFGWPFDTTQAVWRLIVGGVLDEFPTLRIVTHHLGAMLPYFKKRIASYAPPLKRKSVEDYWGQIYGDTAIDATLESLMCAYSFFGPTRMVFGTDYPFGPESGESFVRDNLGCVKMMPLPPEEKDSIMSRNAMNLFKIR